MEGNRNRDRKLTGPEISTCRKHRRTNPHTRALRSRHRYMERPRCRQHLQLVRIRSSDPLPLGLGPSIAPAVYGMTFSNVDASLALYTAHTFHATINQPIILPTGLCLRNTQYFNETESDPHMTNGNVTLYSPPLVRGLGGVYVGTGGYSAADQMVGYFPESCASATFNLDPSSLQ